MGRDGPTPGERDAGIEVEIVVDLDGARHEVRVAATRSQVALGAVLDATAPEAANEHAVVDGVDHTRRTPLSAAGLVRGAVLQLGPVRPTGSVAGPGDDVVAELAVVAGLHAGRTIGLRAGSALIGSAPGCEVTLADAAVSSHQARLWVGALGHTELEDLAPSRPTLVAGAPVTGVAAVAPGALIRLGNHLAVVTPTTAERGRPAPVSGATTIAFNRPPRSRADEQPTAVTLPEPPEPNGRAGRVGLLSSVVMLAGGLAAFVVMRSPLTLIFVGVGAAGALVSAAEARRGAQREARASRRRFAQQLAAARAELAEQVAAAERACWRRQPHLAEVARRALTGSALLWERRATHADAFVLTAGVGPVPWSPVVADRGPAALDSAAVNPALVSALEEAGALESVPITVSLAGGRSVGVIGDRNAALAAARALLLQLAVLHGPADVAVVVAATDGRAWDWTKWLPHTADPAGGGRRLVAATPDDLDAVLAELPNAPVGDEATAARAVLLVVDGAELVALRTPAVRAVLNGRAGPAGMLVVAPDAADLPAACTDVVTVTHSGRARVSRPGDGELLDDLLAAGCDLDLARGCARALARWCDPELDGAGSGLPATVSLLDLIGAGATDPAVLASAWSRAGTDPAPRAPVALAADGVVELDLVRDGPHGLVAGTTGSGKSELLRSIVAGLAARCSPRDLTFVLVDYKGGSAFDHCARLPHTVGMVTDLDGHLAERALRSLEAELTHRERVLREAGATDLPAYRRLPAGTGAPLPRLLVVIDEFATLAAELPDFLDALVGIAQRGRSLGVHLLLATQRPSGAVNGNIRGNTNLRIALRVQDTADSTDVLDSPVAAELPRGRPGRMWLRFGPSELIAAQSARATGPTRGADAPVVTVEPFVGAVPRDGSAVAAPDAGPDEDSELSVLVAAARAADAQLGLPPPRRPWLEPLPADLPLASLPAGAVGRLDLPDEQAQPPLLWDPTAGNLLLYGITGAGTTTALAVLALACAGTVAPGRHHLYVLDVGAGALAPLAGLAHVGAVVGANERERHWRLVRMLSAELDRRRAEPDGAARVPVTLLIDGYGALAAAHDDLHGQHLLDDLARVITDGPGVGIGSVIAAERPGAVPFSVVTTIARRWLFRLADPGDYASYGIGAGQVPTFCPGRAVIAESGAEIQIANPGRLAGAVAAVANRWPDLSPESRPPPVGTLPAEVARAALPPAQCRTYPWIVPVGIGDRSLAMAGLVLHDGEHALIAGPSRSGRTTALATVGRGLAAARPDLRILAITPRRSALGAQAGIDAVTATTDAEVAAVLAGLAGDEGVVLLIDDAEAIADEGQRFSRLLEQRRAGLHVIAAGRVEVLRAQYGHWTNVVRRSRTGVLLQPNPDIDGDLLGAALPRRSAVRLGPGRGYLVNGGDVELVQLAQT